MTSNPESSPAAKKRIPEAVIERDRFGGWVWVIPAIALLVTGVLAYRAWQARGLTITIELEDGHGLETGDELRFRGIAVGAVRAINLLADLNGVMVEVELARAGVPLARRGAQFWVVRPQLRLEGVAGLETVVGPRYLAVQPGTGPPQRHFIGLRQPPVIEELAEGALEVVLTSPQRGNLRAGASIIYRQVTVGRIASVRLSGDGSVVEARAVIFKPFVQLIRGTTRFWHARGLRLDLGLTGVSVEVGSLAQLLEGGVALATPGGPAEVVRNGHRFSVADEAREEWLAWAPLVAIGSDLLPPGALMPSPSRALLGWRAGSVFKSRRSRQGWVLQTDRGLLGPSDLLAPAEAEEGVVMQLELGGKTLAIEASVEAVGDLHHLAVFLLDARWPTRLTRRTEAIEDVLVISDPAAPPIPIAAARMSLVDGAWRVEPQVPLDEAWHGAAVLARSDGRLLGLLCVSDPGTRVALLTGVSGLGGD